LIPNSNQSYKTSFSTCPVDGSIATHLRDLHFSGENVLFPEM